VFGSLSAPVEAAPITLNGGAIMLSVTTPAPFSDVFANLDAPSFDLDTHFLHDLFFFTGTPNPAHLLLPPGTMVEFDGRSLLVSPLRRGPGLAGWSRAGR
jgi:hypothetical protein